MSRWLYISLGIAVNCVWGTAFLIPYYLSNTNPMLVAFGRYIIYGLISVILLSLNAGHRNSLSFAQWRHAFLLAFAGNVGYYLSLTAGIHYGGITITALIVGILPVSMIIAGNLKEKNFSLRKLIMPVGLILTGIVLLNLAHMKNAGNQSLHNNLGLGLLFACVSLVLWTWYGVSNASFLKKNPGVSASTWSIAIGVGCLIQSALGLPLALLSTDSVFLVETNTEGMLIKLVLGCFFLGIIVSWLATIWWNQVSRHLPIAIAGQLIVFETISSLIYGYIVDQSLPSTAEVFSAALIICGVVIGIRSTLKRPESSTSILSSQGSET